MIMPPKISNGLRPTLSTMSTTHHGRHEVHHAGHQRAEEGRVHVITHAREDLRAVVRNGVDAHELLEHRQRHADQHHACAEGEQRRGFLFRALAWRGPRASLALRRDPPSAPAVCAPARCGRVLTSQLGRFGHGETQVRRTPCAGIASDSIIQRQPVSSTQHVIALQRDAPVDEVGDGRCRR